MNNSNIVILQISKNILKKSDKIREHLKEHSSFFKVFGDDIIALFHEKKFIDNVDLFSVINIGSHTTYDISLLNNFAKNRLIANFEESHPELALRIMSSGNESKLIKIKER